MQALKNLLAERLGLAASATDEPILKLMVEGQYPLTLDFSNPDQWVLSAELGSLPEQLPDRTAFFRRIAQSRFNLVEICQEQIFLDKNAVMQIRYPLPLNQLSLDELEQVLANFINTLTYFKTLVKPFAAQL